MSAIVPGRNVETKIFKIDVSPRENAHFGIFVRSDPVAASGFVQHLFAPIGVDRFCTWCVLERVCGVSYDFSRIRRRFRVPFLYVLLYH